MRSIAFLILLLVTACARPAAAIEDDLGKIALPPGFEISIYAFAQGARSLAVAPDLGVVFVGTRGARLYAIVDADGDARPERVELVSRNLRVANGIAYHAGWLYIAEQHRVIRYRPRRGDLALANPEVLFDGLPDKRHHGWRYAAVGPDRRLYVTLGSPCNICDVAGLEGTIVRLPLAGGRPEVFARGIRNSVGLAFHPATGEAWLTDNGGDRMGDDVPPDELNHAPRAGLDFGFPHFAGGDAVSPGYARRPPPADAKLPVIAFGAHVAALGIHFYQGRLFPAGYRHDAFVAQHGSWNRSVPDGYRVMRIRFDKSGMAVGKEIFASGWLQGGSAWGRPVDVAELPDGSLLVSDDRAGVVYRIAYTGE